MMKELTYYELLGVSRNATAEQIKRAYREHMKRCHPDMVASRMAYIESMDEHKRAEWFEQQRSQAEKTAKLVNQAYSVLSDTAKRRQYDVLLDGLRARTRTSSRATGNTARPQSQRYSEANPPTSHRSSATNDHPSQARWRATALNRLPNFCIQAAIYAAAILFKIALAALALFISLVVIAVLYALVQNLTPEPYQDMGSGFLGLILALLFPLLIAEVARVVFREKE